jgi:acid phosphatase class B
LKKIKKGDQVIVLSGKDKGRTGTVLRMLNNSKVLVENINIVKKHQKGNPNTGQEGGIIEKENTDLEKDDSFKEVYKIRDHFNLIFQQLLIQNENHLFSHFL